MIYLPYYIHRYKVNKHSVVAATKEVMIVNLGFIFAEYVYACAKNERGATRLNKFKLPSRGHNEFERSASNPINSENEFLVMGILILINRAGKWAAMVSNPRNEEKYHEYILRT